jgi:RNA polymerase sigma-70 factor (ECF subfamily)
MTKKTDYPLFSDVELVTLLKASDHSAYKAIYGRYFVIIFTQAYAKLGDEDTAKDIVQELFIHLWIKRNSLPDISNVGGYLSTSVRNRIFNYFQHQHVESKYIDSLNDFINTGEIAHADHLIRTHDLQAHIESAIQTLPGKMRTIFEMSRKEHLPHKEIAKILSTSEENVSKQITNAIRILKTKLEVILPVISAAIWQLS